VFLQMPSETQYGKVPALRGVVYQPIVCLKNRRVIGYEALMRPAAMEPEEALSHARHYETLCILEREVLRRIREDAWLLPQDKIIFVNLTFEFLSAPKSFSLMPQLRQKVCIEVPEDRYSHDTNTLLDVLKGWRVRGYLLALDDCSKVSDLPLIRHFVPDFVKVSVRGPADETRLIAATGTGVGVRVVMEEIEAPADLECARVLGATLGQGFLLGKPQFLNRGGKACNVQEKCSPRPAARTSGSDDGNGSGVF